MKNIGYIILSLLIILLVSCSNSDELESLSDHQENNDEPDTEVEVNVDKDEENTVESDTDETSDSNHEIKEVNFGDKIEIEATTSDIALTINQAEIIESERSGHDYPEPVLVIDMTVENIGDAEQSFDEFEELFHLVSEDYIEPEVTHFGALIMKGRAFEQEEDGKNGRAELAPTEKKDIKLFFGAHILEENGEYFLANVSEKGAQPESIESNNIEYLWNIKLSEINSAIHPFKGIGDTGSIPVVYKDVYYTLESVKSIGDEYNEKRYPEDNLFLIEFSIDNPEGGDYDLVKNSVIKGMNFVFDMTQESLDNEVDKYDEYEMFDDEAKKFYYLVSAPDSDDYYLYLENNYWHFTKDDIQ